MSLGEPNRGRRCRMARTLIIVVVVIVVVFLLLRLL
jgi:hypothetical protein